MFLLLFDFLQKIYSFFGVFHYMSLRAILSVLTSFSLTLLLGPYLIDFLHLKQIGQAIRNDGPETHLVKKGTPTMGGTLILFVVLLATLLWADLNNRFIWITLFAMMVFGLIGFIDDYRKVIDKNPKGLPARWKFFWQSVCALTVLLFLFFTAQNPVETTLYLPFLKNFSYELGYLFIVFGFFVIVGSSNAVNLTDGLDGLAILPTVLVASALAVFSYVSGHIQFAEYLLIPFTPGTGELVVICASICGAGFGFLWFNAYPAQVFMGDVGSLSLGATLGVIAMIIRQEVVFFVMSGVFVMEALSVIIQVVSFKLTGKRVFKMAPLHHHFELCGASEPKVIVRFWITTIILVLIGVATLKIR